MVMNPVVKVRLDRDPEVEERVALLLQLEKIRSRAKPTSDSVSSSSSKKEKCFVCGTLTFRTVTRGPRRKRYLRELDVFRKLLGQEKCGWGDGGQSCDKCRKTIHEVWTLHQDIEAKQRELKGILDEVAKFLTEVLAGSLSKMCSLYRYSLWMNSL